MHIKLFNVVALVIFFAAFSVVGQEYKKIEPSLSSDAKRVIYVMIVENSRELWAMNLDGTGLNYLQEADGAWNPRFSPDGKKIVFSRPAEGANANHDIWIINSDGNGLKQLTKTPGQSEVEPDFTPTGNEVVFVRREAAKDKAAGGAGVMLDLADGKEFEFLSKDLNIARIFPVSQDKAYLGCACESKSPKFNLKPSTGGKQDVFQVAPDGFAVPFVSLPLGSRDSIRRFRSARSAPRHVFEVLRRPISSTTDSVEIVLVDDRNTQSLKDWGLIADFDISADGSKVIVSGYRDEKPPQKLWVYDFNTKAWSEVKSAQNSSSPAKK